MNLRLYKTPYVDPIYPHIVRLLFEGNILGKKKNIDSDFYLYVWINNVGYLHAFQAVLGDKITLAYQVPSNLSFGRLTRDIVNRGATHIESLEERDKIISAISQMENDSFPVLLGYIKKIAKGENIPEVKLTLEEMSIFSGICR